MVSAAELIQALQRRLRLVSPHMRREPGEFPPGWQLWLESQRERPGRIVGAPAAALVAILAQRPLAGPPRRLQGLTRWQAFSTMWRQHWQPPAREDRGWRVFAAAVSVLSHILFTVLLLWLTYVQLSAAPPPEGEDVVQIELIGTGSPEDAGGAEPAEVVQPAEAAQVEPSAQPSTAQKSPLEQADPPAPQVASVVEPLTEAPEATATPVEEAPPAVTEPDPVPAEQAVDVSEPSPDPDVEFVLTAPVPRVSEPDLRVPDLRAPAPSVQVVDIPAPLPSEPVAARAPRIVAPELRQQIPDVIQREIPRPLRAPTASVAEREIASPQLQARIPEVRAATIPSPPTPAAAAQRDSPAEAPRAAASAAESAAAEDAASQPRPQDTKGTPSPQSGRSPAPTAGAGPTAAPAPGGLPTPNRADDWGDAARNRPGAQRGDDGLYNSDGSLRLPDAAGSAAPGEPPGSVTDEIVNLDRAGTWLKRPPIDYEPTAFDRYWRPNETLLEEWVRKSIKTVRIPIPGTNKHIVCQTVLLALGGGCGISDPNLNEQPATARPPPDIPFKPELQEDNGSIRPPPAGTVSPSDGTR